jgi:putative transposase
MVRMARVVIPAVVHHVTQRGNRRQTTFFGVDCYKTYLELLAKYCQKANSQVWAYGLMPNHVHLALMPDHQGRIVALVERWRLCCGMSRVGGNRRSRIGPSNI